MPDITLTYDELRALGPCLERFRAVTKGMGGAAAWGNNPATFAALRTAGATFDDLIWAASAIARRDADTERRLRLWFADCAAHVLHIYERTETNPAPRRAIEATRAFSRGEITSAAWAAARAAAWGASDAARAAAGLSSGAAARAASDAAWAAAGLSSGAAVRAAAWVASGAVRAAAWVASGDAGDAMDAEEAEEAWQLDRLIARMSDPEPEDWPLPAMPAPGAQSQHQEQTA